MDERERFFAGFILNKLWTGRYWCGGGKCQHLGHTSLDNLPKGRPRNERGEILEVAADLKRLGFICPVRANRDEHVCASRSQEIISAALPVVNQYRESVGLACLALDDI
jgi:hypothetical protein